MLATKFLIAVARRNLAQCGRSLPARITRSADGRHRPPTSIRLLQERVSRRCALPAHHLGPSHRPRSQPHGLDANQVAADPVSRHGGESAIYPYADVPGGVHAPHLPTEWTIRSRVLLAAATHITGILAESVVDRVIVGGPARYALGLEAWLQYSRHADLETGLIAYPVEGIRSTVLIIAAAVGNSGAGCRCHQSARRNCSRCSPGITREFVRAYVLCERSLRLIQEEAQW